MGNEHRERTPFAAPFRRGGILHRDGQGEAAVVVGHGGVSCYMEAGTRGSSENRGQTTVFSIEIQWCTAAGTAVRIRGPENRGLSPVFRRSGVSCRIALKAPENIPEGPCRSLSGSSPSLPFHLRSPI